MTYRRKSLIVAVVLFLLSTVRGATADDQQLKLEIGLSKSTYHVVEPIWLDATLTNVSPDTVRMFGLCPQCMYLFHIELKDSQGNLVPYTGPVYEIAPGGEGWLTQPQEHNYGCFNLLELFNMKRSLHSFFWQILRPGSYRVQASYANLRSEEIEFEVVEPTGNEKAAYQLLEEAKTLMVQKEFEAERKKLQELINRFPSSVYVEKAHRELFQPDQLLRKFPNSGYCESILRNLTSELTTEEKRAFLKKVIEEHPETRSARYAQQMLKMLEMK